MENKGAITIRTEKYLETLDEEYRAVFADNQSELKEDTRMLLALFKGYSQFPTPGEYMTRIVDNLSDPADGWETDTLRLRILKQFICYGDFLSEAGYGGKQTISDYVKEIIGKKPSKEEILRNLDEGIFDSLDKATKAQKKPGAKYGLIKTADDLAGGKFRTNGATKKSLFMFAMVYNMTFACGEGSCKERDIEVNLFRDYYTSNLMRYVTEAYRSNSQFDFEIDPSGQGINYKNFAEIVYLYYIVSDYSPEKKIELSAAMIERIIKRQFDAHAEVKRPGTHYYRNLIIKDDGETNHLGEALKLTEKEFEKFVCENYNCDTYDGDYIVSEGIQNKKVGALSLEGEQNSAFEQYRHIVETLEQNNKSIYDCNYGLWFADVDVYREEGVNSISEKVPGINVKKFEEFLTLLNAIDSFLAYKNKIPQATHDEKEEWLATGKLKKNALNVLHKNEVTRASVIAAFYYLYNENNAENRSIGEWSFVHFFNNYKEEIDYFLEKAYYQPFSGKNIFDVMVAFSSYAYIKY